MTSEFRKVADWPLASLSLDALYASYSDRVARDACDLIYTLDVANGSAAGVSVRSAAPGAGACSAPLIVKGAAQSLSLPRGGSAGVALSGVAWAPQA